MEYDISINRCCQLVLFSKSVFYYKSIGCGDELLRMRMRENSATWVRYGFWRIYILLRSKGFLDNHKRVYCEEGLNLRSKRPKKHRSAANRKPFTENTSSLHQCWSMGFICDQLYNGSRFRSLTIVDNYS